jgi:hypothetical protein
MEPKPWLVIVEYHLSEPHPNLSRALDFRFRIIEKVNTIDGFRDRITSRTFSTLLEAQEFIKEKEHGR